MLLPANKDELLDDHQVSKADFLSTGLTWEALESVAECHHAKSDELRTVAAYVRDRLQSVPGVHSVRMRIKDSVHLAMKIIRKRIENPSRIIDRDNYTQEITDLVGLRALHLFKAQWEPIDDFVRSTWNLKETPIAYYRAGDPESLLAKFRLKNCDPKEHTFGYRSVHYVLRTSPDKIEHFAELQVRTIFEEGWSEIDHQVRYPRHTENAILINNLRILNAFAGNADEMATLILEVAGALRDHERDAERYRDQIARREEELSRTVKSLKISQKEKDSLAAELSALRTSRDDFMRSPLTIGGMTTLTVGSGARSVFSLGPSDPLRVGIAQTCERCGKSADVSASSIFTPLLCQECRSNLGGK